MYQVLALELTPQGFKWYQVIANSPNVWPPATFASPTTPMMMAATSMQSTASASQNLASSLNFIFLNS